MADFIAGEDFIVGDAFIAGVGLAVGAAMGEGFMPDDGEGDAVAVAPGCCIFTAAEATNFH